MFLQQLKEKEKKEYYFREQTLLWKDDMNNEYKMYVSVILETNGYNRFDYSTFNYGLLPTDQNINVIQYISRMTPKKTYIQHNKYIQDDDIWNIIYYPPYTTKLKNVF